MIKKILAVILLMLSTAALAQALTALPWNTGQTQSYYANDDGALKKGVAWPSPRFTDNGNGTVTDNLTGLTWLKNANCFSYISWQSALNAAKSLANGQCGLTDGSVAGNWHLPNKKELLSLVDFSRYNTGLPVNNPFTNVQSSGGNYWSSTTVAGNTPNAWYFSMYDGSVDNNGKATSSFLVWPVRAGQAGNSINLVISKSGTGSGTVTSSDSKINCGGTCSASYTPPIATTLSATPASGSIFAGWSGGGGCSGTGTCVLNSSIAVAVTATFTSTHHPVRDFNGDGTSDILLYNSTTGAIAAWLMNGASIIGGSGYVTTSLIGWQVAGVGDFNGDGYADILLRSSSTGAVVVWLLNGSTVTGSGYVTTSLDPGWQIVGVGDFDGDGKSDILLRSSTTGAVVVWLMNGFTVTGGGYVTTSLDPGWQIMGVGDFDGDGHSDILLRNSTTGAVAVWLLNGAAIKSGGYVSTSLDSSWQIMGVGDFDGDGHSDILLQNSTTGAIAVWLMNGFTVTGGGYVTTSLTGWQIKGVEDFDGDGKSDILLENSTTGAVVVWLLNGAAIKSGGYVTMSLDPGWQIK